jgi:hypothetical protein
MVRIRTIGHWELGWNTPIKEAELWNLLLRDFGVSDWYMWPVSGIRHNEKRSVNLHEFHDLKSILDFIIQDTPETEHVYFEPYNPVQHPEQGISLENFEHPKDVVYIFGSAHFNPTMYKRPQDHLVQIPTIHNKGVLWPHQCLAVCLYDRLIKEGPWQ